MKKVEKVKEEPKLNGATFLDTLTRRSISLGGRTGHISCARYWYLNNYGVEKAAQMTDADIQEQILKEGLVPVIVNGTSEDDGVFLIPKSILRQAPWFNR